MKDMNRTPVDQNAAEISMNVIQICLIAMRVQIWKEGILRHTFRC